MSSGDYRNAIATAYVLKNGQLIRKAAHRQYPSRPAGQANRSTGQAGRGGLTKPSTANLKRKNIKLSSNNKGRLGGRKAARIMAQGVMLSNI